MLQEEKAAQCAREQSANLRNARETAVASKSDPNSNSKLGDLVEQLNLTREELKVVYTTNNNKKKSSSSSSSTATQGSGHYFNSTVLQTEKMTISLAFKELEAMERTLDDRIDQLCSVIVAKEEQSKVHGTAMEEECNQEVERHLIAAGRLKRMLSTLRDREQVAKHRLDLELLRRSARPPHPGSDAVKDPLKLAENATFLWQVRDDVDTADRVFSQALSRAPDHSLILHLYATFLHQSSKRQHQTSARLWQRAVLLAPRNPDILTSYGTLLHRIMCKPDEAKPFIMRALSVDPKHPMGLLANALLLQNKKEYEESEQNFQDARKYLPNNLSIVTHYSNFLKKCQAKYKEAEALFQFGMTLNPCDPDHLGAFAQFMFKVRGNTEKANYLFQKAIEADPTHWHNLSRHANMLKKTGDYDQAEKCYQKACECSSNPTTCGNYANFLQLIRHDWEKAQAYYIQALKLDPSHYVVRKNYSTFLRDYPEARVRRNESMVDQTPLAKALARTNGNYVSPTKGVTPKGRTPKKKKTPSKFRPRKLAPELESWNER